MRRYFVTGLAIVLPLALTIIVINFLTNLLAGPFLKYITLPVPAEVQKFIILIVLFFATVGLGFLAKIFVGRWLLRVNDAILVRIPLIRTIYATLKDASKTIFTSESNSFKQVVLLPFPFNGSHTVGLVTGDTIPETDGHKRIAVFVPTTPNPTSGYLLLVKNEELTYLDMSVEDALKYVISCGVILVPFKERT